MEVFGLTWYEKFSVIILLEQDNIFDKQIHLQLKKNEQLLFVKVHAPHDVILRSARHYDMNKYFKNNHLDFSKNSWKYEKEIIRAIRYYETQFMIIVTWDVKADYIRYWWALPASCNLLKCYWSKALHAIDKWAIFLEANLKRNSG